MPNKPLVYDTETGLNNSEAY